MIKATLVTACEIVYKKMIVQKLIISKLALAVVMSSFYLLFVFLILITIIDGNEIFRAGKTVRSTENCPICRLHIHNTIGDLRNQEKMQYFEMMQHQTWMQISTPTTLIMMMQENTSATEIPFVSSTSKNEIKEIVNQPNRLQPFMPPKNSMHGAESYVTMSSNK